jgi:hypothetical protein
MHITYIYTVYINNRSYDWDALQKHSVKAEVDCMLHGSQKTFRTQKSTKV